jgi:hypothetical protein
MRVVLQRRKPRGNSNVWPYPPEQRQPGWGAGQGRACVRRPKRLPAPDQPQIGLATATAKIALAKSRLQFFVFE